MNAKERLRKAPNGATSAELDSPPRPSLINEVIARGGPGGLTPTASKSNRLSIREAGKTGRWGKRDGSASQWGRGEPAPRHSFKDDADRNNKVARRELEEDQAEEELRAMGEAHVASSLSGF